MIAFKLYGSAVSGGSKTIGRRKDGTTFVRPERPGYGDWKKRVAQEAGRVMAGRPLLEGPLELRLLFTMVRPKSHVTTRGELRRHAPAAPIVKPDLTKLTRGVEDGMTGVVWRDDSQVCRQQIEKTYGVRVSVAVTVLPLGGTPLSLPGLGQEEGPR